MANRPKEVDPKVLTIDDLKREGEKNLSTVTRDYFNGGAGDLTSLKENESAFTRYRFLPRVLRDVSAVDATTTIFGSKISFPLGFAPSAAHKLAHADGELATSRAAAANNIPMCLSSWTTSRVDEVIAQGKEKGNPYAMQVSFLRDWEITRRVIRGAEKAGYKALFISVDLPVLGNRINETRNNFKFPSDLQFPVFADNGDETGLKSTYETGYDPSITWEKIIPWLRQNTSLEIWLKGLYTPEDIQLAITHGVDGVIISNHGGRQLDGAPGTLDALRLCAPVAKKGGMRIGLDGGIRSGADLFKAIALGADICFVGRIAVWGLAYNGEKGVDLAIKLIYEEFRRTMMLLGCKTVDEICEDHLCILEGNGRLSRL